MRPPPDGHRLWVPRSRGPRRDRPRLLHRTSCPRGTRGFRYHRDVPRTTTASYRALLALPAMPHIVVSLFLSRTAQSMAGVALTLFTLAEFGSATLAGIVAFASFAPGIVASPLPGAPLPPH